MSTSPTPAAGAIVGPFVVRSRKGSFGNQDRASALRMALAQRHEPDVEFIEIGSGRSFNCAELIAALDREDHCPEMVGAPPAAPSSGPVGLGSFSEFATSPGDLDLPPVPALPAPPAAGGPESSRRSDRLTKRSDRKRAVVGDNTLLIGALTVGVVALSLVVALLLAR